MMLGAFSSGPTDSLVCGCNAVIMSPPTGKTSPHPDAFRGIIHTAFERFTRRISKSPHGKTAKSNLDSTNDYNNSACKQSYRILDLLCLSSLVLAIFAVWGLFGVISTAVGLEFTLPAVALDGFDFLLTVVVADGLAALFADDLLISFLFLAPHIMAIRALLAVTLLDVLFVVVCVVALVVMGFSMRQRLLVCRLIDTTVLVSLITVLAIIGGWNIFNAPLMVLEFAFPSPFFVLRLSGDTFVVADSL
jgi:hypothetical protein